MTGYPPVGKTKQAIFSDAGASFSDASMSLCDKLKRDFPQVHMSRRLSIHKHAVPTHVDIDVKLQTPEHEII